MPFLRGSLLLLAFGLLYVTAFLFTPQGLTPEHALVGLLALFGAALLPCLAHTLDVWKQVRSREHDNNPALLALRRDLDLLFRNHEDHAERVHLALHRLETELVPPTAPAASPDPSPAIAALEETVREHIAECAATGSSVRQSIVRLDTSVQKLTHRVEQLEFRFPSPDSPASSASPVSESEISPPPASPSSFILQPSSFASPASSASPVSESEISNLKSQTGGAAASPLLGRALAGNSAPSGHVSRLIAGGFKPPAETTPTADS